MSNTTKSTELFLLTLRQKWVGDCLLFYRKEGTGYTCDIDDAEEFDRDQAESIVRQTGDKFRMWNKNYIDSVAKRHANSEYVDYSKAEGSE